MAESTLTATYSVIKAEVCREAGYSAASLSTGQTTWVAMIIASGLRSFYDPPLLPNEKVPHLWSFLQPELTMTTSAPYSTGTVAVAAGVVTLSGGTFPTWAASGDLTVSGQTYAVSTRDSGTQVTLADTSVTVSSGATYRIAQATYVLPDDFSSFKGPLHYENNPSAPRDAIALISRHMMLDRRQVNVTTGKPRTATLYPKPLDATVGQRWYVTFDPEPDAAYRLRASYLVNPNTIDGTNLYSYGGMHHSETLIAACLAAVEYKLNAGPAYHAARFKELIQASILRDREMTSPERLGPDYDRSMDNLYDDFYYYRANAASTLYNGVVP